MSHIRNIVRQLLQQYLLNQINAQTFCDQYHIYYDLEASIDDFDPEERKAFLQLSTIANRFSEFEEDLTMYSHVYFPEESLRKKIIEISKNLKKNE